MYTGIKITTPVHLTQPTNIYSITLRFQLGDADGESMNVMSFNISNPETADSERDRVVAAVNLLSNCMDHTPIAEGGSSYSSVPGWDEMLSDYWEHDHIYDCEATLDGYEVYYFDHTGTKFNVEMVTSCS